VKESLEESLGGKMDGIGPLGPQLAPDSVLVRTLYLPTSSPRQAMSAVKLRLDQLSPAPAGEILFDVARLDDGPAMSAHWAVGIARRGEVVQVCDERGEAVLVVRKAVEGREVEFRFRDPSASWRLPDRWAAWLGPATAGLVALTACLGATVVRTDREMALLQLGDGGAQILADRSWRLAADRDVAVRSWINARRGGPDRLVLCGARLLTVDGSGPRRTIVALDGSPDAATFTMTADVPEQIAKAPGVTVSADGPRRLVRVTSQACAEARP
jgi:hypothetical protein